MANEISRAVMRRISSESNKTGVDCEETSIRNNLTQTEENLLAQIIRGNLDSKSIEKDSSETAAAFPDFGASSDDVDVTPGGLHRNVISLKELALRK